MNDPMTQIGKGFVDLLDGLPGMLAKALIIGIIIGTLVGGGIVALLWWMFT